jgi:hypothetical protein
MIRHLFDSLLVSTVFLIVHLLIHPFDRGFYCTDETIRFPYKEDTVPLWVISEILEI